MTAPVLSPCVSLCGLSSNNICRGCFRSSSEITYWTTFSDDEKRAALERCEQRKAEYQENPDEADSLGLGQGGGSAFSGGC